jgi:hypothetical protein
MDGQLIGRAVAALVSSAALGVLGAGCLGSSGGSAVATTAVSSARAENPPAPPRGSLVLAHELGSRAVALAIDSRRRQLTATVLSGSGGGASGLHVSFRVGSARLPGRVCGTGCYRVVAPKPVRRVLVEVNGSAVSFELPATAPSAAAAVGRATRVFSSLRSLVYVESLRSSPTNGIVTTWKLVAPHRLAYKIRGGAAAVVIGERRWDQTSPGAKWQRSRQVPALDVPQPTWGSVARNAHLLGRSRVRGRPVFVVSFVNPTIPAWFTAWIDRSTYRTLQLRMTAAAHFMFHRYLEFNAPVRIKPPR